MHLWLVSAVDPGQLAWKTVGIVLGSVAAIVVAIRAIGRLIPSSKKYSSAGGNVLMRAEIFFRPSREHIIEAKQREDKEDEQSGDPPAS